MRHFTLEEADEALAGIRPQVERMVEAGRQLRALGTTLAPIQRATPTNGGSSSPGSVHAARDEAGPLARQLADAIAAIEAAGALVKDVEAGLVDFAAVHPATGETVLLCWRLGEQEIGHWHGTDEGFAGRKPLPFS